MVISILSCLTLIAGHIPVGCDVSLLGYIVESNVTGTLFCFSYIKIPSLFLKWLKKKRRYIFMIDTPLFVAYNILQTKKGIKHEFAPTFNSLNYYSLTLIANEFLISFLRLKEPTKHKVTRR